MEHEAKSGIPATYGHVRVAVQRVIVEGLLYLIVRIGDVASVH